MSNSKNEGKSGSNWDGPEKGLSGEMIFTGPDYLRQHRVKVVPNYHFVGEGTMSPEGTSDLSYLWRAHPSTPHPRPKSTFVGEIGWSLPDLHDFNCSNNHNATPIEAYQYPTRNCFTDEYQNLRNRHPFECDENDIDAYRTPCSALMRPMVRVNSTPAALGNPASVTDLNTPENRCGWYAVPNSSNVPLEPEIINNGVCDSFGGTKSPLPEY